MLTNIGNYLIEVDGVALCEAQEVEMGGTKHEPFTINTGTRPNALLGRGKYMVEEVKIKQAYGLNNEGASFAQIFQDYIRGVNMPKVNIRVVTLGEDGFTVVATDDFTNCVPTSFTPDGKKADGKDAAHFSAAFKPTDHLTNY